MRAALACAAACTGAAAGILIFWWRRQKVCLSVAVPADVEACQPGCSRDLCGSMFWLDHGLWAYALTTYHLSSAVLMHSSSQRFPLCTTN